MLKDFIDFITSYPLWAKLAVAFLIATAFVILVAARPSPVTPAAPNYDYTFRIDRVEASRNLELVSLNVNVNGNDFRYPATYQFAQYERNMPGGEYALPAEAKEYVVAIRALAKYKEDRRLLPRLPAHIVELTLDFQPRQPIRIAKNRLPIRGEETLRFVEHGVQRAPQEYNLRIHYSAQ